MIDDAINNLTDFIKDHLKNDYKWNEVSKMTLTDLQMMSTVFEERKTTIDKAFPFLF